MRRNNQDKRWRGAQAEPRGEDAHPENINQRDTAQGREDFKPRITTHIQQFQKSHPRKESMVEETGPLG